MPENLSSGGTTKFSLGRAGFPNGIVSNLLTFLCCIFTGLAFRHHRL